MERTTEDFMQLGKIFIGWGLTFLILFIGVMAAYASKADLSGIITSFPFITVIPLILAAVAASISYCVINSMKGLYGLTKPLLAVWLAIIAYATLSPALGYMISIGSILKNYHGNNVHIGLELPAETFFLSYMDIGTLLFAFAFGLLCLRIFTRLKFAGVLAFIYFILVIANCAVLSIIHSSNDVRFLNTFSAIYNTFSVISYSVIISATFLIAGGYLEVCRARRS